MRAGIISAGFGERLAPGFSVPKPMVPICGEPMIGRLIRVAHNAGITSMCCIINERSPQTRGVPALTEVAARFRADRRRRTTPWRA